MTIRKLTTSVAVATFLLLVWGMAFWGVLYEPAAVYTDVDPAVATMLAEQLADSTLESGAYFIPWPRTAAHADTWLANHRSGPFFELHFSREGVDPQSAEKFLLGSVQYLVVAALAAALLLLAGPLSSGRRFALVACAGLMGTTFIQLSRPIWFHLPWHYSLAHASFELGATLVLASTLTLINRSSAVSP